MFWLHQTSHRCSYFNLYGQTLHMKNGNVNITECCLSVVCTNCYNLFLMSSHKCIHEEPCSFIHQCRLMETLCIKICHALPYSPTTGGRYERFHSRLMETLRTKIRHALPYSPTTGGRYERFHRVLKVGKLFNNVGLPIVLENEHRLCPL